jgi:hypothetical protein
LAIEDLSADDNQKKVAAIVDTLKKEVNANYKPDPMRVVWMGAIIPGYGQILNRSYWKLPIVYAGFLGCGFMVTMNSVRYETYKKAYQDISDSNDATVSYLSLLPKGATIESYPGGISRLQTNLKSYYEQYRRNRDLSIIASVGYYAITLVEAYVDAQLFDFDISPDLSMQIRPSLLQNNFGQSTKPGVQVSFRLK